MPLIHKTFTKVIRQATQTRVESIQEEIQKATEAIDNEVNAFTSTQHWSQARDAFQETVVIPENNSPALVIIMRTYVFTTEQMDKLPSRPPV